METFFIFVKYTSPGEDEYGGWGVEYFKIEAKNIDEAKTKAVVLFVLYGLEHKSYDFNLDKIASKSEVLNFSRNFVNVPGIADSTKKTVDVPTGEIDEMLALARKLKRKSKASLEKMLGGKLVSFHAGII